MNRDVLKRHTRGNNARLFGEKTKLMNRKEESRWVRCPLCGGKTRTKVYEDTVLIKFPLYCPKCKREIRIDVVKLKMVLSEEPDAFQLHYSMLYPLLERKAVKTAFMTGSNVWASSSLHSLTRA